MYKLQKAGDKTRPCISYRRLVIKHNLLGSKLYLKLDGGRVIFGFAEIVFTMPAPEGPLDKHVFV